MNVTSNGSLLGGSFTVGVGIAAALFGGFAATMVGCPGPVPHEGSGGGGGSTSSTSSTTSSTSSTATSSTSSSTSSGTGGMMMCNGPEDCPPSPTDCATPTCDADTHLCGVDFAGEGKPCFDNGGHFCDGQGQCVSCIIDTDCPTTGNPTCSPLGVFSGLPTCVGGKCAPPVQDDCFAKKLPCDPNNGCVFCTSESDCKPYVLSDCETPTCDTNTGACGKMPVPLGSDCALGTCNGKGSCKPGQYVFVTSMPVPAGFGGASKADDICNAAAAMAGHHGTWAAWVSDATSSPAATFNWMNLTGPYRDLDDNIVGFWVDLVGGTMLASGITVDESHGSQAGVEVWTGTQVNGMPTGVSCGNWMPGATNQTMGTVGFAGAKDGGKWTNAKSELCSNMMVHLYCFQQ